MTYVYITSIAAVVLALLMLLPICIVAKGRIVLSDKPKAYVRIYLFCFIRVASFDLTARGKGVSLESRRGEKTMDYKSLTDNALISVFLKSIRFKKIRLTLYFDMSKGIMNIVYLQTFHIISSAINRILEGGFFETKTVFTLNCEQGIKFNGIISFTLARIVFNLFHNVRHR